MRTCFLYKSLEILAVGREISQNKMSRIENQSCYRRCFWAILSVVAVLLFTRGSDGALIFNGKTAEAGAFPFAVSLQLSQPNYVRGHTCTISLITTETCLGAAHCAYMKKKKIDKKQLCGIVGFLHQESFIPCKEIAKYEHPKDFDPVVLANDIAVYIFKTPVEVGPKVKPIALAGPEYDVPLKTKVDVIGWGWTDSKTGGSSRTLRYTSLHVAERSVCKEYDPFPAAYHFCIYDETSGIGVGDSGAPVFLPESVVQVAVITGGLENCSAEPFIAVDVRKFHDWIVENSVGELKFV